VLQTASKENRFKFWTDVLLAVINGSTLSSKEYDITGVVLSSRARHDTIQIWNGCPLNAKRIKEITSELRTIINAHHTKPSEITVQYEVHRQPIQLREKTQTVPRTSSGGRGRGRMNRPQLQIGSPKDVIHKKFTSSFSAPPSPSTGSPAFSPKTNKFFNPLKEEQTSPSLPQPVQQQTETIIVEPTEVKAVKIAEVIVADAEKPVDTAEVTVQEEINTTTVFSTVATEETSNNEEAEGMSKRRKKSVKKRNSIYLQRARSVSIADTSKRSFSDLLALSYNRDGLIRFVLVFISAILLNTIVYIY
jgi:hypothetical protein